LRIPPSAKEEHERATRGGLRVDFVGFALVALGLGSLQVVLDKGQEDDWFASGFILTFAFLAAFGIVGAIIWELFVTREPIVDLPLFRDRNFLFTNLMMFATMFILLSTTQMLPQFVQQLLPYDATRAGLILMPGGFAIMLMMPIAGFLVRKVQPKHLIAAAFLGTSLGLYHLTGFETNMSFKAIATARVLQVLCLAFLFVPIQTLAYSDLPKGKSNNASALINLMRNLGGSVGVSIGTTLLVRRSQIHQDRLVAHLTSTALQFQAQLASLTERFAAHGAGPVQAGHRALSTVMRQVQTQAAMLSYLDIFVVLMLGCLIAAAFSTLLKTADLSNTQAAA